jgi:dihydrofolate reductase
LARKIILKMHVSLDGYIRAENDESMDWVFHTYDDLLKAWEVESLWQAGTHIMGRVLYKDMSEYWPTSMEEYAEPMNTIPKVVFSRTLQQAKWNNTRIANGDTVEEILRLKQESGKDILAHGGAVFTQSLTKLGLIDEYRLIIHPVVLSAGLPLFAEPVDLKFLDSQVFPSGSMLMVYRLA